MLRRDLRRRAVRIAGSAATNPVARIPVPTPVPVPVPVVFDLRFGTSGNLNFDAANFSRHGDTANGVLTVDVPGPTVRPALWLPIIAGIPLAFLRSDLEVPIFSVGPIALLIGGVGRPVLEVGFRAQNVEREPPRRSVSAMSLTELSVAALVARATGVKEQTQHDSGVVAAAAGRLGRALALADVAPTGSPELADLLPSLFHEVGRSLIYAGESVFLIEVRGGSGERLMPVSHWDVAGTARRWRYRCDLSGPSGFEQVTVSADEVLALPHQCRCSRTLARTRSMLSNCRTHPAIWLPPWKSPLAAKRMQASGSWFRPRVRERAAAHHPMMRASRKTARTGSTALKADLLGR